jgi:hypothetical protein
VAAMTLGRVRLRAFSGSGGGEVSAHRLKKHPVVCRLVELIQQHQLQLVLRGQYGTTAQARAAAPEVMSHLSELAGAQRERDWTRRGRAALERRLPRGGRNARGRRALQFSST